MAVLSSPWPSRRIPAERDLQNPWSSYPVTTSVQVQDFNRAKEKAFLVKAAYDFTPLVSKA